MFEALSDKLKKVFKDLRGQGRLTEAEVLIRQAIKGWLEQFGPDHRQALATQHSGRLYQYHVDPMRQPPGERASLERALRPVRLP